VAEVVRQPGISEQTFYRWKAKVCGPRSGAGPADAQLQEENLVMPPRQAANFALMDAVVRRGFRGEVLHVRHGSEL
jgi:hypothetical protein